VKNKHPTHMYTDWENEFTWYLWVICRIITDAAPLTEFVLRIGNIEIKILNLGILIFNILCVCIYIYTYYPTFYQMMKKILVKEYYECLNYTRDIMPLILVYMYK